MAKAPLVLVVDDEQDICENLKDILGDLGFEVDTANNGAEALELVRKNPYEVALLDLKMPGMDGVTLYREIKQIRAGTVAIVVTAYASDETAEEALDAGAWKILSKPVDFSKLLALVEEALDQPLIMIVDDDHDLCASLWDTLRDRGYRVEMAHDIPTARDRLISREFRVVLVDMKLPDGDGSEVFHAVRQICPTARTVVVTGFRSELEELVQRVLKEGADDVCYKPFDVPTLLNKIQRLSASR